MLIIVAVGALLGLLIGLIGGGLMALKDVMLPLVIYNQHALWMAPIGNALLGLLLALPLALLHRVLPRLFSMRVILFLLALPLLYGMLRVYAAEIAKLPALLVSLGAAWRLAEWRRLHDPHALRRLARRSAVPLVSAVPLIALLVIWSPAVQERMAQRGRPAAAAGQPNVLLIILDTVRALSMSLHGYERATTPALTAFASRGVTFDLAFAPAPWTLPTHASLFTGRYPHELNATWRVPLDDAFPTLAERMANAGYRTGAVVANLFNANSAMGLGRGFDRYTDYTATWADFIRSTWVGRLVLNGVRDRWFRGSFAFADFYERRTAREVSDDLIRWIEARDDRPFFAFANYFDAHDPYIAPEFARRAIAAAPLRERNAVRRLSDGALTAAADARTRAAHRQQDGYEAALLYLDSELGRLFDALQRRGLLDNTIVVITSDHGEEFGEHGVYWHAHSLYAPALHVPLAIVAPGTVPPGLRVADEVTLRDVAATILDLAGLEAESGILPGSSLARYWTGSTTDAPSPVVASLVLDEDGVERWPGSRRLESLVLGGMHYILNEAGPEELYDLRNDPLQTRDLAADGTALGPFRRTLGSLGTPLSGRGIATTPDR